MDIIEKAPREDDAFFLPYQKKWILDDSRIKLMEKSRQIGLSWSAAYDLVRRHAQSSTRTDSWVSSRDELQAKLFMQDCKNFCAAVGDAAAMLGSARVIEDGAQGAVSLCFANGTCIHSLSSNADAQAGKRGARVLDEFALHPDPAKLYAIAYPGITWGGQLHIISTHRGSENFFNKLVEEARHKGNPKRISLHRVTLEDALNQGFLKKLKKKLPPEHEAQGFDEAAYYDYIKNSCADSESFMQEYMCRPADDEAAFIPDGALEKCLYEEGLEWRAALPQSGSVHLSAYYLGVDVARSRDLSVFWILERRLDTFFTRDVITFKNAPFSEQEAALDLIMQNPRVRKCAIDQTGLGRQFAERAAARHGASRVEGVNFGSAVKEMLAYPLKSAFEDGKVRIPRDKKIIADIHSVRRETTPSGNIKFSSARFGDGHADRFWALALALYAAKGGFNSAPINLVGKRESAYLW